MPSNAGGHQEHLTHTRTRGEALPASPSVQDAPAPISSKRDLVLHVASSMLGEFGYARTSMRAIGQAAGIRGPSIYHHFVSKDAIVEELLALSLNAPTALASRLARESGDPATRLFRMIMFDFMHLYTTQYDFRGVYNPSLLARPNFSQWRGQLDRMHEDIRAILDEGIRSGRFIEVNPALVQEAISGLVLRIFAVDAVLDEDAPSRAEAAARFILRAILAEPEQLQLIAERAQTLFDQDWAEAEAEATVAGRTPLPSHS